jgi:hypothetical protein
LRGYLNVDLPPEERMPVASGRPDIEADVLTLNCPSGRLAEIRHHHVFEHFERAEAFAALIRWHDWLCPGGLLVIETPDFDRCIVGYGTRTPQEQTLILRHLFGSQEAPYVLPALGYGDLQYEQGFSDTVGLLANITVRARKSSKERKERIDAALGLLKLSMNGNEPTERELYARWQVRFDELIFT